MNIWGNNFMAIITGTTNNDILTGTSGDDTFLPYGVTSGITGLQPPDWMSGGNGGDTYDLRASIGSDPVHHYIIDDNGTDGAIDRIEGAGELIHTASFGYIGFATAVRDGDDLVIVTPYKPHRFRDPSQPSYEITIVDHFAGEAVEIMVAGGVTYQLSTGSIGSGLADIMAGTNFDDVYKGKGGADYMTGNDGNDTLVGGGGDDYLFGGTGNDILKGNAGSDRIYGGTGDDTAIGGNGNDRLELEDGDDTGRGGGGDDYIYGQDGNDRLVGGGGVDMMSGGRGDDTMLGGKGSDTYRYGYDLDGLGSLSPAGHDIVKDNGDTPAWNSFDRIQLFGFYGPSDASAGAAFARLDVARVGQDMVITTDGGTGSITAKNQFGADKFAIEELEFSAGYWSSIRFKILDGNKIDIGDDRNLNNTYLSEYNELLFGTDGNDQVFGDAGTNFIWLGAGSDTLIYKESDAERLGSLGGGIANDIVMDFNLNDDMMDFTEMGITMANLTIGESASGNALVHWDSPVWYEISDIYIELRGISASELTADHFIF